MSESEGYQKMSKVLTNKRYEVDTTKLSSILMEMQLCLGRTKSC